MDEPHGLIIGDHALVGALHFVHEDDVDVGSGALLEAPGHDLLFHQQVVRSHGAQVSSLGVSHGAGVHLHVQSLDVFHLF